MQDRRGGRTPRSMSCGINVSEFLVYWASDTYIRCLLPQLVVHSTACDVSSAHHLLAPCLPRPVLHVRCPPCFAPGFVCHACFPCTYMRTQECIRSVRWACTRASKHVGTCILYCAIYNKRWALISFRDVYVPACHCFCGYTLTITTFHTLPYYRWTQRYPCLLSQTTTIGGGFPLDHVHAAVKPSISAWQCRLSLSLCSPLPALFSAKTSLSASHPHNTLACN